MNCDRDLSSLYIDAHRGWRYNGEWFWRSLANVIPQFGKENAQVMKGNSYLSRKIHSLLGVIPLGLFIIEHMLTNYSAYEGGAQGFKDSIKFLNDLPLVFFLELFGIWLPLLFHGVYGLYVAYQSNVNTGRFQYGRNWAFTLQRISGVITFIFIFWHLYQTRYQVFIGKVKHEELGGLMHAHFDKRCSTSCSMSSVL